MSRRAVLVTSALLWGLTLQVNIVHLVQCGNSLSASDPISEADAIRSAERYARFGFLDSYGLPDVSYGNRFEGLGTDGPSGHVPGDTIYHGYPPGSNWLTGLYARALGVDDFPLYRVVPVTFGILSALIFLEGLKRTIGPERGFAVYAACLASTAFTSMNHNLYFHGYALGLLLLEITAILRILGRPGSLSLGWLCGFALVGFLQGWLTFEYAFLVTFVAVPLAFFVTPPQEAIDLRAVALIVLASGTGFVAAHALHFLQSVLYFGSLQGALDEYAFRAGKVYGLAWVERAGLSRVELWILGLRHYAFIYFRWTQLFSPASIVVTSATVLAIVASRLSVAIRGGIRAIAEFSVQGRHLAGLASALLVSLGWLLAKPHHAIHHEAITGRHLFVFYLASCLFVVCSTRLRVRREGSATLRRENVAAADRSRTPIETGATSA